MACELFASSYQCRDVLEPGTWHHIFHVAAACQSRRHDPAAKHSLVYRLCFNCFQQASLPSISYCVPSSPTSHDNLLPCTALLTRPPAHSCAANSLVLHRKDADLIRCYGGNSGSQSPVMRIPNSCHHITRRSGPTYTIAVNSQHLLSWLLCTRFSQCFQLWVNDPEVATSCVHSPVWNYLRQYMSEALGWPASSGQVRTCSPVHDAGAALKVLHSLALYLFLYLWGASSPMPVPLATSALPTLTLRFCSWNCQDVFHNSSIHISIHLSGIHLSGLKITPR